MNILIDGNDSVYNYALCYTCNKIKPGILIVVKPFDNNKQKSKCNAKILSYMLGSINELKECINNLSQPTGTWTD